MPIEQKGNNAGEWLDAAQVCHLMGLSRGGLQGRIARGEFPAAGRRRGKKHFWNADLIPIETARPAPAQRGPYSRAAPNGDTGTPPADPEADRIAWASVAADARERRAEAARADLLWREALGPRLLAAE